jgi:Tfp pilus assembly protein PilO
MRNNLLPNDTAQAEREIISAIDGWSRDSGVEIAGLHPQWKNDTDDYRTLNCGVEVSGSLSSLSQFLYDVEKGPMGLKLDSMALSAGDHSGDQMTMSLQVSGLALTQPNPTHPTQP